MGTRTLRTTAGPSDRVVVVGAGLSGLAAALYLRAAGREVTVLERARDVGGRVGLYRLDPAAGPGYRIDSGATVLTMPELVYDALDAVGAGDSGLQIHRLDPAYHARFADGSTLDVHSDPQAMADEVRRVCGPDDARGYLALRRWLEQVFEVEFGRFIDANFDSPTDLVSTPSALADTARLVALGAFGRLGPQVARRIADPRLRRVFTFQALYAGLAPNRALAVYGAIPHMDTSLGVYFPEGGMHAVPRAMADALVRAGGRIELETTVAAVDLAGDRARGVRTEDGRVFACDALVITADLPVADELLGGAHRPARRTRWAPSAVVLHGTIDRAVTAGWDATAHHTIDFGHAWESTFARITARHGRGSLMSDPSLLVTRPGLSDPGLNLDRRELLSVLAPCPNLDSAPLAWEVLAAPYGRELLGVLESRGYRGIADEFSVDHVDTPATWLAQGMGGGSPFSAAHTFGQTGPFRRRNLVRGLENVVLSGCGTTPGVGVPTTLISGKLAAARITGAC